MMVSQARQVNLDPLHGSSPHGLHDLPPPRHHFQRLRDVLPQLGQLTLAAGTSGWAGYHHALARQMRGQRTTQGLAAGRATRVAAACRVRIEGSLVLGGPAPAA